MLGGGGHGLLCGRLQTSAQLASRFPLPLIFFSSPFCPRNGVSCHIASDKQKKMRHIPLSSHPPEKDKDAFSSNRHEREELGTHPAEQSRKSYALVCTILLTCARTMQRDARDPLSSRTCAVFTPGCPSLALGAVAYG